MADQGVEPRSSRREVSTTALGEALGRLLSVEPDDRAPLRIVGVVADVVPSAAFAALARPDGDGHELLVAVGLEDGAPERIRCGLADEALSSGQVRLSPDAGPPFPAGIPAAAAPAAAGETRAVLLLGVREGELEGDVLLLLRVAAERVALLLELARLARERDDARAAAGRAESDLEARRRAVDFILGVVGHDLRNPLGAVHMSAALLQKKGGLAGWQARTVERMRSSAGRMGRIIADLLSYTRTRLGKGIPVSCRAADLGVIVARVVDELRAVNPDREIRVEASGDLGGVWDPDRLEQVASNLVSNAIDHGDPGTPVEVALSGDGDAVALSVRNAGDPMPPEVLSHLFEPFSRPPDEKRRKASGLGLGLYISREIVRGHGGEIAASSGAETVVTVRLPRRLP